MKALASFFEMGGYGVYVWPAYGVAAIVLLGLLAASLRTLRAREGALKALDGERPAGRDGTGREASG